MPTTVHIPKEILKAVDDRAKALGVSRNRFIVNTLEKELKRENQWPAAFLEVLRTPVDPDAAAEFRESMEAVYRNRRSRKGPPKL